MQKHTLMLDRYGRPIPKKPAIEVFDTHSSFDAAQVSQRLFYGDKPICSYIDVRVLVYYDGEFVTVENPVARFRGANREKPDLLKVTRVVHDRLKTANISYAEFEIYDVNGYPMNQFAFLNYLNHPHKNQNCVPLLAVVHKHAIRNVDFTLTLQEGADKCNQLLCRDFASRNLSGIWTELRLLFDIKRGEYFMLFFKIDRSDNVTRIGMDEDDTGSKQFHSTCMDPEEYTFHLYVQNQTVPWANGVLHLKGFRQEQVAKVNAHGMYHNPSEL